MAASDSGTFTYRHQRQFKLAGQHPAEHETKRHPRGQGGGEGRDHPGPLGGVGVDGDEQ
jgi:hypothetical protein